MRIFFEVVVKLILVLCGLFYSYSTVFASSCESDCSAIELGLGIAAGSTFHVQKSSDNQLRTRSSALVGASEFDIGYSPHSSQGWFGALSFQSLALEPLKVEKAVPADTPVRWSGGGLGGKLGLRYGALSGWAGAFVGSLSDENHLAQHSYFGPAAGLGLALYRSEYVRLELQGAVHALNIDGSFAEENSLVAARMYRQQVGLHLNFLLDTSHSGRSSGSNSYNFYYMNWSGGDFRGAGQLFRALGSVGASAGILLGKSAISLIKIGL